VLAILLTAVLVPSLLVAASNISEYLSLYRAVAGVDVAVSDVRVVEEGGAYTVLVALSITNPSDMNIKVVGVTGHVRLGGKYLGVLSFRGWPEVIGAGSYNVTVVGELRVPPRLVRFVERALREGMRWEIYGWATFGVRGQTLMVEYRARV